MQDEIKKITAERNLFAKLLEDSNLQFEGKIKELSLLKRIGDIISDSFNIKSFCQKLVQIIIEETEAENCSLLLKEGGSDNLILKVAYGIRDTDVAFFEDLEEAKVIFAAGEGIAGKVALEGKAIMINDVSTDERFDHSKKSNLPIGSIICCPLIMKTQVMGVINLSSSCTNAFSNDDLRSITIFSAFASSILNNAISYNTLTEVNSRLEKAFNKLMVSQKQLKLQIEESKEAEEKIIESRDFLENIFKTSVDGIIVTDKSCITMVNEAMVKMLGYSRDELIGKHTFEFVPQEQKYEERGKEFVEKLFEEGVAVGEERTWIKKDGSLVHVEMNAALMKDEKGKITSLASIRDITERKKSEKEIIRNERIFGKPLYNLSRWYFYNRQCWCDNHG